MGLRTDLQNIFENILGSNNVYYQPPETVRLKYPCIIYQRAVDIERYADDSSFFRQKRYTVTLIDPNPDTILGDKISDLPYCSMNTSFTKDNLNHYVYNIYF